MIDGGTFVIVSDLSRNINMFKSMQKDVYDEAVWALSWTQHKNFEKREASHTRTKWKRRFLLVAHLSLYM